MWHVPCGERATGLRLFRPVEPEASASCVAPPSSRLQPPLSDLRAGFIPELPEGSSF